VCCACVLHHHSANMVTITDSLMRGEGEAAPANRSSNKRLKYGIAAAVLFTVACIVVASSYTAPHESVMEEVSGDAPEGTSELAQTEEELAGCYGCASSKTMRKVRDVMKQVKNLLRKKINITVNVKGAPQRRRPQRRRRVRRRRSSGYWSGLGATRVWSGYCNRHGHNPRGWRRYCTTGSDFNTAGGFLQAHGNGVIRIRRTGDYRMRLATIQYTNGWRQHDLRLLVNGRTRDYSHNAKVYSWRMNEIDTTMRLHAGWNIQFQGYVTNHGNRYAYHAGNAAGVHSRVQITYLGSRPMFSGFCRHHSRGGGWKTYCLNGVERRDGRYFRRHGNHAIRVQRRGYYRINARNIIYSPGRQQQDGRILINGRQIAYSHNYEWSWSRNILDVTWPLNAGDRIQVQYYTAAQGRGYAFHAGNTHGHHSRLQVTYEGPRSSQKPIWSGGCSHSRRARSRWFRYCLNRRDFNTAGRYLSVHGNGIIRIRKAGMYRLNAFSIQYQPHYWQQDIRTLVNGRTKMYSHNYDQVWNRHSNDLMLPLKAGDSVQFQFYAYHHRGYAFHAGPGAHSRVQISYEGRK